MDFNKKNEVLYSEVERMINGDFSNFNHMYELSVKYIYKLIYDVVQDHHTTEDLVQETYVTIYNKINGLKNPRGFYSWAGRIATNNALMYVRKAKDVLLSGDEDDEACEFIFDRANEDQEKFIPEDIYINKEKQRLLANILDALPVEQKLCVQFFYYEDLSVQEIADIMECSTGTVKSRLNYARKAIKEAVVELDEKQGTRLYSIGGAALLYFIFRGEVEKLVFNAASMAAGASKVVTASHYASNGAKSDYQVANAVYRDTITQAANVVYRDTITQAANVVNSEACTEAINTVANQVMAKSMREANNWSQPQNTAANMPHNQFAYNQNKQVSKNGNLSSMAGAGAKASTGMSMGIKLVIIIFVVIILGGGGLLIYFLVDSGNSNSQSSNVGNSPTITITEPHITDEVEPSDSPELTPDTTITTPPVEEKTPTKEAPEETSEEIPEEYSALNMFTFTYYPDTSKKQGELNILREAYTYDNAGMSDSVKNLRVYARIDEKAAECRKYENNDFYNPYELTELSGEELQKILDIYNEVKPYIFEIANSKEYYDAIDLNVYDDGLGHTCYLSNAYNYNNIGFFNEKLISYTVLGEEYTLDVYIFMKINIEKDKNGDIYKITLDFSGYEK